MTALDLLLRARRGGVRLWAQDERLRYSAAPGALDDALRADLVRHRAELLDLLSRPDGVRRSTRYLVMSDGARLAADIMRPTVGGRPVDRPLPVVWCLERYRRAQVNSGRLTTKLDTAPWLSGLLRRNYVVVVVDARGTGASDRVRVEEFAERDAQDGREVVDWLAAQPWCDGDVGMFGDSHLAIQQFLTASTAPAALRAIVPQMPMFDLYASIHAGGVFRRGFVAGWRQLVHQLDTSPGVAPVEGRTEDVRAALTEHHGNDDVLVRAEALPHRDSPGADGRPVYPDRSPSALLDRINAAGVPVLLVSGWYDLWIRDALLWFTNLRTPKQILIGPWPHARRDGLDLAAEHAAWYARWLTDHDDSGAPDPAPIRYRTINARPGQEWRECRQWPPPGSTTQTYYLAPLTALPAGPKAAPGVLGQLGTTLPPRPVSVTYTVDYSATSGRRTRWANTHGAGFSARLPADRGELLDYRGEVLDADMEITGHPLVHLFVSSTHDDGDFFVYLEDLDPVGGAHYITEGVLRASHRATAPPPYDNLGLPYHPGTEDSLLALAEEPVELILDLHPTSYLVRAGHRLRLTITCCDRDNAHTPVHDPAPVVRVHSGPAHPSAIRLPVVPAVTNPAHRSEE